MTIKERIKAIAVGDWYRDNDKRVGDRTLVVVNVLRTPNGPGAATVSVYVNGQPTGRKGTIRGDRLVRANLFTKVEPSKVTP